MGTGESVQGMSVTTPRAKYGWLARDWRGNTMTHGREGRGDRRWSRVCLGGAGVVLAFSVAGCALPGASTSTGASATSTPSTVALTGVPWCDTPLITFQDDSTTTLKTITSWDAAKSQLGFTPYLPPTLPRGTCLALAGGALHDPIFGGHFEITYVLPKTGALSFSEAPKRANLPTSFQCVSATVPSTASATATPGATPAPTATPDKTTNCLGVVGNTAISIASTEQEAALQTLFKSLKPGLDWVPPPPTATATPSNSKTPAATGTSASK